ncbi:hypothetical protein LR48_Vigan401s004900 [Vigna angularis]|uniref:GDSL esterase/lipase n=1 Tax=Phaseolus angularis TaxID=3914 RepID=A0A0L9TAJ1_PHAAN|nr:hypothetical protein LR48_Vigan401s004900 [Vigna angularis]
MSTNVIVYFLVSTVILSSTFVESRTLYPFEDPPFRQQLNLSPSSAPSSLVPAVFVIGDSSVDCRTNNFLGTFARADHLPYPRDFDTHQPTGRLSNGRIPVD